MEDSKKYLNECLNIIKDESNNRTEIDLINHIEYSNPDSKIDDETLDLLIEMQINDD